MQFDIHHVLSQYENAPKDDSIKGTLEKARWGALLTRYKREAHSLKVQKEMSKTKNLSVDVDALIDLLNGYFMLRSEMVETSKKIAQQKELWNELFLSIGALYFINKQRYFSKEIRQVCAGIGPNWSSLTPHAQELFDTYPPKEEDLTHTFLQATIASKENTFEDNVTPFPFPWFQKAKSPKEIPIINLSQYRASPQNDVLESKVLYSGKDWKLSLLLHDNRPSEILLEGTYTKALCDDILQSGAKEDDVYIWKAKDGLWTFTILGKDYSFQLKGS